MEWRGDGKAASGERAVASAPGGFCSAPLARLEPERTSACLHAARATPVPGDTFVTSDRYFATHRGGDPLPCATSAFASLLARAAGSQCAYSYCWSRHHQALWHPSHFCGFARLDDSLTQRLPTTAVFYSDPFAAPCSTSWPFSLAFPSLLPFWLPVRLLLLSLTGLPSSSQRLSLLQSALTLPQTRCAIRGKKSIPPISQ